MLLEVKQYVLLLIVVRCSLSKELSDMHAAERHTVVQPERLQCHVCLQQQ